MKHICTAAFGIFAATFSVAIASAAENNYTRLDKAERAACIKASGFVRASVSPKKIGFSDQVGYDIRLVSGRYPQKHMKGARGKMACAYKRGSGRVEVQEFQGW
jgi:hypothetical protein